SIFAKKYSSRSSNLRVESAGIQSKRETNSINVKEIPYHSQKLSGVYDDLVGEINTVDFLGSYGLKVFYVSNNFDRRISFNQQPSKNDIDFSLSKIKVVSDSRNSGVLDAVQSLDGEHISFEPREAAYILVKYKFQSIGDFNFNLSFDSNDGTKDL